MQILPERPFIQIAVFSDNEGDKVYDFATLGPLPCYLDSHGWDVGDWILARDHSIRHLRDHIEGLCVSMGFNIKFQAGACCSRLWGAFCECLMLMSAFGDAPNPKPRLLLEMQVYRTCQV